MKISNSDCMHCGGEVDERTERLDYLFHGQLYIVETVTMGVCRQCGEKFLLPCSQHKLLLLWRFGICARHSTTTLIETFAYGTVGHRARETSTSLGQRTLSLLKGIVQVDVVHHEQQQHHGQSDMGADPHRPVPRLVDLDDLEIEQAGEEG